MLPLYIINSLEVEGAGVSPSKSPGYLAPALCMFGLLSVVFSASPIPSVRFLGQAHAGHKRNQYGESSQKKKKTKIRTIL
jgi:hypothetical protein